MLFCYAGSVVRAGPFSRCATKLSFELPSEGIDIVEANGQAGFENLATIGEQIAGVMESMSREVLLWCESQ